MLWLISYFLHVNNVYNLGVPFGDLGEHGYYIFESLVVLKPTGRQAGKLAVYMYNQCGSLASPQPFIKMTPWASFLPSTVQVLLLAVLAVVPQQARCDIDAVRHAHGSHTRTVYLSTLSGNDTHTGSSPDSAWRSLAMVGSLKHLQGVTVLLESGSVWIDQTLTLDGMGSAALSSYGDADAPRPAVWRSRSAALDPTSTIAAEESVCIQLYNPVNVTVENVHIAGCFRGLSVLYTASGATGRDITIRNNSFADIRTPYGAFQPADSTWGVAIDISGIAGTAVTNVVVANNVAIRCGTPSPSPTKLDVATMQ